jgi:hypothetical protein
MGVYIYYSAPLAMTNPVTPAAPFYLSVFAQASRVAPVVYMSSNPTTYLIQCNDNPDFAIVSSNVRKNHQPPNGIKQSLLIVVEAR